jgi:hypothetical protein
MNRQKSVPIKLIDDPCKILLHKYLISAICLAFNRSLAKLEEGLVSGFDLIYDNDDPNHKE